MEEEKKEKNEEINPPLNKEDSAFLEEEKESDDLKMCLKDKEEYLSGWKRAKADLENYKREEASRVEMLVKFANVTLLKDLLAVMDSFDLAIKV